MTVTYLSQNTRLKQIAVLTVCFAHMDAIDLNELSRSFDIALEMPAAGQLNCALLTILAVHRNASETCAYVTVAQRE